MPSLTFVLLVLAVFLTLVTLDNFRLQHDQLVADRGGGSIALWNPPVDAAGSGAADIKYSFPPQQSQVYVETVPLPPRADDPATAVLRAAPPHHPLQATAPLVHHALQPLSPPPSLSTPPPPPLPPPPPSVPQTATQSVARNREPSTDQTDTTRKNAYVTLLSTSKERRRYIGYLSGIIVAQHSLRASGSTADFILMIAPSPGVPQLPPADQGLLDRNHVMYRYLKTDWTVQDVDGVMLAKIYCWKMIEYNRIVYMDSDVLPTTNMDSYFSLDTTTGFAGGVSPLNGGFLVLTPSMAVFEDLRRLVASRGPLELGDRPPLDWDSDLGWGKKIGREDRLDQYEKDGGKLATGSGWSFNAAWSDQGLLYYYFRFLDTRGGLDVVLRRLGETKQKKLSYRGGALVSSTPLGPAGFPELFAHFAGRVKPWNVCATQDERALVAAVKQKVRDPSKITRQKGRAFWLWHSIYGQLDVDLSVNELSGLMTAGLNCRGG